MTAMTPSSCSARVASMRLMRAWGCGECRILPMSIPGTVRSSVYLPAPVVLPAASIMAMGRPMMEKLVIDAIRSDEHLGTGALARPVERSSASPLADQRNEDGNSGNLTQQADSRFLHCVRPSEDGWSNSGRNDRVFLRDRD